MDVYKVIKLYFSKITVHICLKSCNLCVCLFETDVLSIVMNVYGLFDNYNFGKQNLQRLLSSN